LKDNRPILEFRDDLGSLAGASGPRDHVADALAVRAPEATRLAVPECIGLHEGIQAFLDGDLDMPDLAGDGGIQSNLRLVRHTASEFTVGNTRPRREVLFLESARICQRVIG